MDFSVVKYDSVKAVGKDGDGDNDSTGDNNEFITHPEGEPLSGTLFVYDHFTTVADSYCCRDYLDIYIRMGQ